MKNAQEVAKVEKRREDARALPKSRDGGTKGEEPFLSFARSAFYSRRPSELECDASSHRFWAAEHSGLPLRLSLLDEFRAACERSCLE
jgi:hypothetical protein